jgi:hypothetical protein
MVLVIVLPLEVGHSCEREPGYVQDERYIAIEHMDKVRPCNGREGGLGHVRRDCVNFARVQNSRRVGNLLPTRFPRFPKTNGAL